MSSTSVRDAQRCLPKQQCLKCEQREPFGGEDTQFGDGCEKKQYHWNMQERCHNRFKV